MTHKEELLAVMSTWFSVALKNHTLDLNEFEEDLNRMAKNDPKIALISEELKENFYKLVNIIKTIEK